MITRRIAKTHLSRLVEKAATGKPMVRVSALDSPVSGQRRRIGFLAGRISVPDDFNDMGREQISEMFEQ